jgi:hypothetical protein
LPVGQVAAEHGETGCGEGLGEGDQQRGLGVAAGAVGQNQAILIGSFGNVQESSDVGIDGAVGAFEDRGGGQVIILNRRAMLKTGAAVIEDVAVEKLSVSEIDDFATLSDFDSMSERNLDATGRTFYSLPRRLCHSSLELSELSLGAQLRLG